MKKSAFTLTEALLALTIIGVVSAIAILPGLSPFVQNERDGKNKLLFQKCNKTLQQAISNLSNDEINYPHIPWMNNASEPEPYTRNGEIIYIGLGNFLQYSGLNPINSPQKFCSLIRKQIANKSDFRYIGNDACSFTAKDGSYWSINVNAFYSESTSSTGPTANSDYSNPINYTGVNKSPINIIIDINGLENNPNCPTTGNQLITTGNNCSALEADTFLFHVFADGTIKIPPLNPVGSGFDQLNFLKTYHYFENERDTN